MKFRIHPEADEEEDKAADFYGERSFNLGLDFIAEVRAAYTRICEHPEMYSPAEDAPPRRNIRNFLLPRFSYRIVYWVRPANEIVILAVAHTSQRPGYWRQRLTN